MDISIIIPTCNRRDSLRRCLDSLAKQTYPKEKFEVIVVDDRPQEDTEQLLKEAYGRSFNLVYLSQNHSGPAAARNRGVKEAKGCIIGFTDDDCVLDEDWVKLMAQGHDDNPDITVVGGLTRIPFEQATLMVGERLSNGAIQANINGRKEVIFFPTCNVSLKKRIFDWYKFNEQFRLPGGEDLEFFWRLFNDGQHFVWRKDAIIVHYRDSGLRSFVRQAYAYGRGNLLVKYLYPDQPLLQELKTGRRSFWIATLVNCLKIPKFSRDLSNDVIRMYKITNTQKKARLYLLFALHKIAYIAGNISEFMHNVSRFAKKPYGPPRTLILDVTHSCNLSCRICEIWKTADQKQDIPFEVVKRILGQARALGIREVCLTGGEPLSRTDIFEIINHAEKLRIKPLGLISNGILLEQYMDKLAPYFINGVISMNISLDSLARETHNYLRNAPFVWDKAMAALQGLSLLKKKYPQINFNITTIIFNHNLEELIDLAKFVQSLQANSIQFQPLLSNNLNMREKNNSAFWVPPERYDFLDAAIDTLINFKKANPCFVRNSIKNLSLIKKYYRKEITHCDVSCASAHATALMTNEGIFTTCISRYGNIKEQGLAQIMKGAERIRAHKKAALCPSPCLLSCFCE